MKAVLLTLVITAITSVAAGQSSAPVSTGLGDPVRPPLVYALTKIGDVGNSSHAWQMPSAPELGPVREPAVVLSQESSVPSAPTRGHLAIWDHLVVAAALGTVMGRAVGYCEAKGFDVAPVIGHVAAVSLFSLLGGDDSPYVTRHRSKQAADRLWDTPLISAGVGALVGFLEAYGCEENDPIGRAPRDRMAITGAAVLGVTGLVLDILHKNGDGGSTSTISLRIGPAVRPIGVGVSISSRF